MRWLAVVLLAAAASAATVRVQVAGRVTEMELEKYVAGVLGGEASVFQSAEALKAMAVVARTYAAHFHGRHASEGFDLCETTHCQRLDLKAVTARLIAAVAATAGQVVMYRDQPAKTFYHLDCGGSTEEARAVWPEEAAPYLVSQVDPYCIRKGAGRWHWDASAREVASALVQSGLRAPRIIDWVLIERRTRSRRAQELVLTGGGQNTRISASTLRFAIGRVFGFNAIRSDSYNVRTSGDRLVFDGSGSGHGVGLCQNGADQMGIEGRSFREILAYYYQGTTVAAATARIDWRRIAGERVALFTTQPDRDGALLQDAERLLRAAERRVQLSAPASVELRVYPDVAAFRDATGEPGWVAARASGHRVQMQPAGVLRSRGVLESTLQHELLHIVIEQNAGAGLPVWFREGLAAYLTTAGAGGNVAVREADLRQISEQDRARAAYEAARRRVADLVGRYGEGTVLGWLKTGLPREVTNASSKQVPTKSK